MCRHDKFLPTCVGVNHSRKMIEGCAFLAASRASLAIATRSFFQGRTQRHIRLFFEGKRHAKLRSHGKGTDGCPDCAMHSLSILDLLAHLWTADHVCRSRSLRHIYNFRYPRGGPRKLCRQYCDFLTIQVVSLWQKESLRNALRLLLSLIRLSDIA